MLYSMLVLKLVLAYPHEWLHVLGLYLVGHRPAAMALDYVLLPDGLADWQRVVVFLTPALAFLPLALLAGWVWFHSPAGQLLYSYSLVQLAGAAYDYADAFAAIKRRWPAGRRRAPSGESLGQG